MSDEQIGHLSDRFSVRHDVARSANDDDLPKLVRSHKHGAIRPILYINDAGRTPTRAVRPAHIIRREVGHEIGRFADSFIARRLVLRSEIDSEPRCLQRIGKGQTPDNMAHAVSAVTYNVNADVSHRLTSLSSARTPSRPGRPRAPCPGRHRPAIRLQVAGRSAPRLWTSRRPMRL